jgi:hypothetical protein
MNAMAGVRVMVALLLALGGCGGVTDSGDDGGDDGDGPSSCEAGARRCDGTSLVTCNAEGTEESTEPCGEAGCDADNLTCNVCTAGAARCDEDVLYTCNQEGDEESAESCGPAGCNSDTLSCNPCAAGTARCVQDVLYVCEAVGQESQMACGELEFCGRDPADCHPLVVAGFADLFSSGYIYLNNDGDKENELAGIKWTLDEAIELRRLGLFVYGPVSPEASIITFFIFDDSSAADPTAGNVLHQQEMTVTYNGDTEDGWVEVDAEKPVVVGPGDIWLIIQAPPPVYVAQDWDGPDTEWWYHDAFASFQRPNIYISGAPVPNP